MTAATMRQGPARGGGGTTTGITRSSISTRSSLTLSDVSLTCSFAFGGRRVAIGSSGCSSSASSRAWACSAMAARPIGLLGLAIGLFGPSSSGCSVARVFARRTCRLDKPSTGLAVPFEFW